VNGLSFKVFQRERRFPSGYDLQKYTNGGSREGLRLDSQTIQAIAAE
jgi:putative transposase